MRSTSEGQAAPVQRRQYQERGARGRIDVPAGNRRRDRGAVAFTLLLAHLLAACVLATAALPEGYGLRVSTDATVGGAIAAAFGIGAAVLLRQGVAARLGR